MVAIMRFKRGSKVEVFSKEGSPSGTWRCARIVCGNGHTYTVRYEGLADMTDKTVVERIYSKAIRPCPPPLPEREEIWVPGDVVEVYDDFSWKMATISKVWGKDHFIIRILGSTSEFRVSKFEIRTRQLWQHDKWIVIGKGSGSCKDTEHVKNSTFMCKQNSLNKRTRIRLSEHVKGEGFPNKNFEKFNSESCRTLKRGPYKQVEVCDGAAQKFRAVQKEGNMCRVIAANQSLSTQQVGRIAFPNDMMGEKFIHVSFNNQTGFSDLNSERRNQTGVVGCSPASELEFSIQPNDSSCSVGSCSINSNNYYKLHHYAGLAVEDFDGHYSDAESFCQRGYKEEHIFLPSKEDLAAEIHRLELHAYRCTMEALYASGPLSWDQEALVTNLRLSLHISNDEHLMEVRNLVSADNSIPTR